MIGCLNLNGHDCNQSDLDIISFVSLDVLEDAEIGGRVSLEALIYEPFNDNDMSEIDEVDEELDELLFWSNLTLGSDYDWDPEPEETPAQWVARRYAEVIRLNEENGFTPVSNVVQFTPAFVGQSRINLRRPHWSDKRSLRELNPNYDKLRGKAHAK